jgi:hypothetical protein
MKAKKKVNTNVQYVIPLGNAWAVKSKNGTKFLLISIDKRQAISFAREIAKTSGSKLVVYGKKMQILSSASYAKRAGATRARS